MVSQRPLLNDSHSSQNGNHQENKQEMLARMRKGEKESIYTISGDGI
jgi:hypothetical protein